MKRSIFKKLMQKNSHPAYTRKILMLAAPMVASNWINLVASFICMLFVAQISHQALAAGALAMMSFNTIIVIPAMTLYGLSILMRHARGQKNLIQMGVFAKNSIWVALITSIPCALIVYNMPAILLYFGQKPTLVDLSYGFFHIAAIAIPLNTLGMAMNQLLVGIDRPRISLIERCIRIPIVVLLAYMLILGKWGAPQLGLTGSALAMLLPQISFWSIMLCYVKRHAKQYQLFTRQHWWQPSAVKHLFKIGLPIGVQFGGELTARMFALYLLGLFGAIPLAASESVMQYSFFIIMMTLGISQAVSALLSESLAQQKHADAKGYFHASIRIYCVIMIIVALIFLCLPHVLTSVFIAAHSAQAHQIQHLARLFFIVAIIGLFIDGLRNLFSAALRGYHDSKTPMLIGTICLWVISLPAAYLIGVYFNGGPVWLRAAFISGVLIATLWLWFRLQKRFTLHIQ